MPFSVGRAPIDQLIQVVDAMVVYNHAMGVSRGFGFVTFKDRGTAEAMVTMCHCINGKTVEAKLALPKGLLYFIMSVALDSLCPR